MVSGIGCTGRVAGYANLDCFHTTHGRAIPFATGLKLSNPELQVVVYSGDGDLFAIGGNHFIHAARRNMDIKVICVNNLTYAMTGGQTGPGDARTVITATSPYGVFEPSFNLVSWPRPPARATWRAGPRTTSSSSAAPWTRCCTRRASASSKCSRPARRSTSGATRWAMGWTP